MGRPKLPDKISSQMRLEPVVFRKLKAIAARENRSMNAQLEHFARQGIERYEQENGRIDLPEDENQ